MKKISKDNFPCPIMRTNICKNIVYDRMLSQNICFIKSISFQSETLKSQNAANHYEFASE